MAGKPKRIAVSDADLVERLARIGCTQDEIAEVTGLSQPTISKRYRIQVARARAAFRMSIRRAQYKRAVKDKSDKMLIWLGKVELKQSVSDSGDTLEDVLANVLATAKARDRAYADGDAP
jgi:hypothetical protein